MRHAEKRRECTCRLADRIAELSIAHYRKLVPKSYQEEQRLTCLATFVLQKDDSLEVVGMGVGTKFLSEATLAVGKDEQPYGKRVRDMHAEVLARRAFQRYMLDRVKQQDYSFLQAKIHFYTSSAPCGNAALKRFATLRKEFFRPELGDSLWPTEPHAPLPGHSRNLGEFALLLKKDRFATATCERNLDPSLPPKLAKWLMNNSVEWCLPGTTATWAGDGSIHTCSDKILRWNLLGLQGSLLSSILPTPIYMDTITVGRKLSNSCLKRAVCCRAVKGFEDDDEGMYRVNHPAVMGTSVCMDNGALNTSNQGDQVRFLVPDAWVWWPTLKEAQKIDGETGCCQNETKEVSGISTDAMIDLFVETFKVVKGELLDTGPRTLAGLRKLKTRVSSKHEAVKEKLLTKHTTLREWRRR